MSLPLTARVCTFLVLVITLSVGHCGDLEKGLDAYRDGDYKTALQLWRPLAEQGNPKAEFNLGLLYRNGRGVEQDDNISMMWFLRSANQGFSEAQYNVGVMIMEGRGATVSRSDARKWWELAAEQQHAGAIYNLGVLYAYGMSVPKNVPLAITMWKQAAQLGHGEASVTLYKVYSQGLFGITPNSEEAGRWQK